jgi:predicted ferric reductase
MNIRKEIGSAEYRSGMSNVRVMKKQPPSLTQPISAGMRMIWTITILAFLVALWASILTIPYFFESQSMYYKFGWDKILLRSGKMVGLTAALLVFLQLPLAGRLKWLDRIFSLPRLYSVHRLFAYAVTTLVILHPVLVFMPDKKLMIPFEARYWPEWVGAGLLVTIVLQFGLGRWRIKIFKAYYKWVWVHRIIGITAMVLLTTHILFVSETFEHHGLPRNLVIVSAAIILALWLWIRLRALLMRHHAYTVERIAPAGENAYSIDLRSETGKPLDHLPGQFAFLAFESRALSREPHPFTISSSPSKSDTPQFTIRGSGDWTRRIKNLEMGDKATIHGPFGHFSHFFVPRHREIIMIAGGIGITPMLSMLRYMADTGDNRRTTLIWSNQTPKHLFHRQELNAMAGELTDFNWIPTFTREKVKNGYFGRLNRQTLESLLQYHSRSAAVFICGPPQMIRQLRKDLKCMGFQKGAVHFEAFGF